ncbi:MAG: GNAT family N-acetyltransferase [Pyrinomonadaceae bacterium]|jgi:ribosomal protein S18 acetylase RimI-like enzyme|nr:GNAT family N-acetyltransferase [Pyrinomonadaceae bacterium]
MEFRPIASHDYEAVRQLCEAGWQHRIAEPEKFKMMLDNSDRTIVAVDGSRIVGFARALCDEVSNGYISMVAVAPNVRRQGIGSELIRQLTKDDHDITWVLRAGRGSDGFWKKIGFKTSEIAMEKWRA